MLFSPSETIKSLNPESNKKHIVPEPVVLSEKNKENDFIDDTENILTKTIGMLKQGITLHYYSYGNFNLVRLILFLLKQTGPANIFMTSYSFSQQSVEQLLNRREKKQLLSFRVIVDNRVKSMSPKPFQMLSQSFDYRCSSIHAKVALIWNEEWKISIVTSQNATYNPKMERGSIFTSSEVFQFDYNALENEFNRGTT